MRMIGYYVFHTIVNQIRKLFKTWVMIMILVCALIGGLVGFGAATLFDEDESQQEQMEEFEEDTVHSPGEFYYEDGLVFLLPEGGRLVFEAEELAEALTLPVGLLIVMLFLFGSDKNGGRIFQMADVNLLFTSPMKPQSVLMFRLSLQLGTLVFATLYFGCVYLPSLISSELLSIGEGICIVFAFVFLFVFGLLMRVLIYTLSATRPKLRKPIQGLLYGCVILTLGGYALYWKQTGGHLLAAAIGLGKQPILRAIPVLGWLKGLIACIFSHNGMGGVGFAALLFAGGAGLILWIWSLKADFYEDAMAKSEEIAALQRQMEEKGSVFAMEKKDRKERKASAKRASVRKEIAGDGFSHGSGAVMYFCKAMHIRYRFGKLHYFTKTAIFYLASAAVLVAFGKTFSDNNLFVPGMIGLCIFIFFRSMGNPVEEDTGMVYFRLIPGSMTAKLFFSILGAAVNCLLDALPAVLLLMFAFRESPLHAAAWIMIALSVTLYADAVGAFMDISIPVNAGATIKQTIQVLFIYFGLLPDAAILAVGMAVDAFPFAAALALIFGVNIVLAFFFTYFTGALLSPQVGDLRGLSGYLWDRDRIRMHFSRIGWALFALYAGGSLAQLVVMLLVGMAFGEDAGTAVTFSSSMLPLYAIGFPLGIWLLRRLPDEKKVMGADAFLHEQQEKQQDFGLAAMIRIFFIMMFLTYLGVFAGNLINMLLTAVFGSGSANVVETIMEGSTVILQFIFMVVLAPIFEEYVFRKLLIDRMAVFGEKRAVLYSALLFGLFHGNLNQTIYASLLGIVLGYVYLRSRRVRYTILLHMIFNFLGSIVAGWVTSFGEESTVYLGYQIFIITAFLLGGFLLLVRRKKIRFYEASQELCEKDRVRVAWWNGGMLTFSVMMGIMILIVLAGSIASLYL